MLKSIHLCVIAQYNCFLLNNLIFISQRTRPCFLANIGNVCTSQSYSLLASFSYVPQTHCNWDKTLTSKTLSTES